jgi:hypothetical protein
MNNEYAEYPAFSDDYLFIGHARQEISNVPGCSKITFSDPKSMKVVNRIYGRWTRPTTTISSSCRSRTWSPDRRSVAYRGWVIAVPPDRPGRDAAGRRHRDPDATARRESPRSRAVGITFSDNIELATVNAASLHRPAGGRPGAARTVRRADERRELRSDADLQPGTTYEVVLRRAVLRTTSATPWRPNGKPRSTTN